MRSATRAESTRKRVGLQTAPRHSALTDPLASFSNSDPQLFETFFDVVSLDLQDLAIEDHAIGRDNGGRHIGRRQTDQTGFEPFRELYGKLHNRGGWFVYVEVDEN